MVSVVSLLLVIALSMLVIRIGTVALSMTGLSEEVARLQSLSAFSGTGFTTDEAESVVKDPARRRIATLLIRLGAIGVVSSIALGFGPTSCRPRHRVEARKALDGLPEVATRW